MNKYLVTASAFAMLIAAPALAADQSAAPADTDVKVMENTENTGSAVDSTQAAATEQQPGEIDANELIGKDIHNSQGEELGEVNSVILSQDGQVQSVIVGVGGFLGIGQRDVAISWDELNVGPDGEEIVANLSREQLEQMPEYQFAEGQERGTAFEGGDLAGTPSTPHAQSDRMAAAPSGEMNVGTAGEARSSEGAGTAAGAGAAVGAGAGAASGMAAGDGTTPRDGDAAQTQQQAAGAQEMGEISDLSADEVIGRDVVNMNGEDVGEIEDIVLDQNDAKFAVISVGGFLGMGDKSVAVSLDELKLGENDAILMSEATEEQLKDLPEYDKSAYKPSESTDGASPSTPAAPTR